MAMTRDGEPHFIEVVEATRPVYRHAMGDPWWHAKVTGLGGCRSHGRVAAI
jgi:hypothetical protein